jgi:hypothetical protein
MKPYLTPNPALAFVIEWGVLILSILLVFSPFIYLGIRKWKKHLPITWKQIFISYFSSFLIYYVWDWVVLDKLDRWIYNSYINSGWLQNAFFNPSFRMIFINIITWPLLVFYCTKLVKERFTRKNFIISLLVAIAMFILLTSILAFMTAWALTNIGSKYF